MRIGRVMDQSPETFYHVACRAFIPSGETSSAPFGSCMCEVEPLQTSQPHRHHEHELFYICSGVGEVTSNRETRTVRAGDVIFFEPFADHSIRNSSSSEPLQFLALYWEDQASISKVVDREKYPESAIIFTAPPTPNGDLHLGHLSGPFSGADIYRRFLNLQGAGAYHSCGRDDHQSYVVRKARQEGRFPEEVANTNSSLIQQTLAQADIALAYFHSPTENPQHRILTQSAFEKLYREGFIYEKEADTAFCRETGAYLYEAHISGTCPHCLAASDGNACEQCGQPNDCADLINPRSNLGSKGVEIRKMPRLFFRLSEFTEKLSSYHRAISLPSHLAALCEGMLREGLPDICVAHPSGWGIPVPLEQYSDHRIYVWFEMAFGYLISAQEVARPTGSPEHMPTEAWRQYYQNPNNSVVHFFGYDNGYFHTLLLPAIYMAYDGSIRLPQGYVVNELLSLDGSKFSTSRGHLIWGRDLLSRAGPDYVRYYLAVIRPETTKSDFRLSRFFTTINSELCDTWQSWLTVVFKRCNDHFDGVIPSPGAWNDEQRRYYTRLSRTVDEIELSFSIAEFSPSRVCMLVGDLVREAIRFSSQQAFMDEIPSMRDMVRTAMALELLTAKVVAVAISPIMPIFGSRLFADVTKCVHMEWRTILDFCNSGIVVPSTPRTYFEPINLTGSLSAVESRAA